MKSVPSETGSLRNSKILVTFKSKKYKNDKIYFFILAFIQFTFSQIDKIEKESLTFPTFYNAIKNAADGDFSESKLIFEKALNEKLKRLDATVYLQVCNDVIGKKLSKEAGQYIFKSIATPNNYKHFPEVMFFLNRASGIQPDYALTYLIRGKVHLKNQEYNHALFEFSKVIELSPKTSLAYYYRGKTNQLLSHLHKALKDLSASLKLENDFVESYLARSEIYFEQEQIGPALNDFRNARVIDSTHTKGLEYGAMLNDIGIKYMKMKDYPNCIIAFTESIIADSRWNEPYLNRGICYRLEKKYDLALKDFNKAIELKPEFSSAYYNRGITYKEIDSFQKAKEDLIQATFWDDKNAKAYYALGELYSKQGNIEKAVFYLKKTTELEKDHEWAYYWLGFSYDKKKTYHEAIFYYDKFLQLVPEKYFKHKISIRERIKKLRNYLDKGTKHKLKRSGASR